MKLFARGLHAQLMLLVMLAMIPPLGVIGISAYYEHEEETRRTERDAMNLVQLMTREQSRLVADTRQLLINVSKLPAAQSPASAAVCNRVLADMLKNFYVFTNIGVATPDGDIYCSAYPLPGARINIADRSYFRHALESRDLSIGSYQVGRVTGRPSINFGYPLLVNGQLRGVAYASLDLKWIERMMADIQMPAGSILMAFDVRGTIVARYPDFNRWVGQSFPEAPIIREILTNRSGTTRIQGLDGVPRLYAYDVLLDSAGGSVHVAVGIPSAVAYAKANDDFIRNMIFIGIATVLAMIAAWVGSDMLVLRRVNALTNAAQRLRRGDLSVRTGLPHNKEEMGELARSFDEMAASLQRVNRALKTLGASNRALARAPDEGALFADVCRAIVEVGGYKLAWIGLAEQDEYKNISPIAICGFDGSIEQFSSEIGKISWENLDEGRTPASRAIISGKPYIVTGASDDIANINPKWIAFEQRHQLVSSATFPITLNEKVIGVLSIYSNDSPAFDVEELGLLEETVGDLAFGVSVLVARAENESNKATIERMVYYDRLTGLPNHAEFEKQLRIEITAAKESNMQLTILVLDINRLREINDALGFHQGDLLLKQVGERVCDLLSDGIMVARMRGDEFAALIPDGDVARVVGIVHHVMEGLRAPFNIGSLNLDVEATAGISIYPQHGVDVVQLLRHADVAMQQAKKTGKDYIFYSSEQGIDSAQRLALAGELRHAIKSGELVLYYQPKIDLKNGRVCGAEALVRWIHPERGLVRPDEFIALAESTGLIKPLTDWVMEAAMRQIATWRGAGILLPVAVNLSARNLHDVALQEKTERLFTAHDAHSDWLELEITEGAMMADPEGALKILTRLSDMGIKLFIDDFGTGYSSLGYLKKLPVDAIKIDKSFVMDMITSRDSAAIVRSTIGLAHDLNLKVVAEGVESKQMLDQLVALGCDAAQGFYFTKPLPADQFLQWMKQHSGSLVTQAVSKREQT